ncbi:MAG: CfxA family class A extended-spectrum beta-lactamase, partial [Bacteroidaceae bacterium]|nr:CfxA family class A extended-spectrum beta-lactamase [Bacteroidaceae bacterium]
MKKNRKKQIVVLCIALVCIFILVFSLSHKSATKGSANPPLTDVLT